MSYIVKCNGTNINDYVIDCGAIPAIQRNRDFTIVLGEVDMTIDLNIPSTPQPGDKITIANESSSFYPFYIGKVSEKKYDYDLRAYRLQIRNILADLQVWSVSYNDLHSILIAGATAQQYRASDNEGYPSVQVLWILQKMFELADIEIDLPSSIMEIDRFTFGGVERIMQMQHLRMDENMLYAINQQVATNHTRISAESDKLLLVPTFLDFFQWLLSGVGNVQDGTIGFNIRWSTSGTPEQLTMFVRNDAPITSIDDDNIYGKEDSNVVGDDSGWSYEIILRSRQYYATTDEYSLVPRQIYSGEGKNSLDYPTNFVYFYEKYWTAAGDVIGLKESINHGTIIIGRSYEIKTYNAGDDFTHVGAVKNEAGEIFMATGTTPTWSAGSILERVPAYVFPTDSFVFNKKEEAVNDYSVEDWVTDSRIITNAKENHINLATREAEILQER